MVPTRPKPLRLLAVSDQWDIAHLLSDMFPSASVALVINGEEALEQIDRKAVDLALVDLAVKDSLDLLGRLVRKAVPTVMLTQKNSAPKALSEAIQKGAVAYLAKRHLDRLPKLVQTVLAPTPAWKILFHDLDSEYDLKFGRPGTGQRPRRQKFWDGFEMNWNISKGVQERLRHNPDLISRGI
jgi:CheY-like chemotaxis protein